MNKTELVSRIIKNSASNISTNEVQIILRLVTLLAATHLANKVDKIIKELEISEKSNDIIKY